MMEDAHSTTILRPLFASAGEAPLLSCNSGLSPASRNFAQKTLLHPHNNAHLTQHPNFSAWESTAAPQAVCGSVSAVHLQAQPSWMEDDDGMCAFWYPHPCHHHHFHHHHHYHHQWTPTRYGKLLQSYPEIPDCSVSPTTALCGPMKLARCEEDLYAIPRTKPKKPTAYRASGKLCPPLPSLSAPPYILCQYCYHLLFVPTWSSLDVSASIIKLRCGICKKTSIFSALHLQKHEAPPSFNEGECKNTAAKGGKADGGGPKVERDFQSVNMDVPSNAILEKNGAGALANTASAQTLMKLDPEFPGFTSVQDWVKSLAQEGFMDCPTPSLGGSLGSDFQPQVPLDWSKDSDKYSLAVPGAPLHEHFGYKSPAELLGKVTSSGDQVKSCSDTVLTMSTSAMSTNTFSAFEPPECNMQVHNVMAMNPSKVGFLGLLMRQEDVEQEHQVSLAGMLKRLSSIGPPVKRSLVATLSSKEGVVVVNGRVLSSSVIKRAEEQTGKLYPGTYWYDRKAGFWGVVGGPCMGVLPPFIKELDHHPMARDCSNGDTEETSGQELIHLGKLAPTVERRGKGFGMYTIKLHPPTIHSGL